MTFIYQENQQLLAGSREDFFLLTGAQWTDEIVHEGSFDGYDATPCAIDLELTKLLLPPYRQAQKNPKKLFLRSGACKGGFSVHAADPIEKGSVVIEYVGQWLPHSSVSSPYRFGPLDALHYRNYSGIIEDGFPNLGIFYLYNVDRVPLRIIFVAIDDIKAGEMLTFHYGMKHSVKVQYHDEYKAEEVLSFFKNHSLDALMSKIKQQRKRSPKELGWKGTLELEGLAAKLRYLYHTPSTLALLLERKIIPADRTFALLTDPEIRYFILGFSLNPGPREKEIVHALELLKKAYESHLQVDWGLMSQVRQRVFFHVYLPSCIEGGDALEKCLLWNEALDAVQAGNRLVLERLFLKASNREELIQFCIIYAKELGSPLLEWL